MSFRAETEAQEAFYHCTTDEPPFGFPAVEVKLYRPPAVVASPASKMARASRASTDSPGVKVSTDMFFRFNFQFYEMNSIQYTSTQVQSTVLGLNVNHESSQMMKLLSDTSYASLRLRPGQ